MEIHTYPTAAVATRGHSRLPPPPDCFLRLAKKRPFSQGDCSDRPTKRSRDSSSEQRDYHPDRGRSVAEVHQSASQLAKSSQTFPQNQSSLSPPLQRLQSLAQKRSNPEHDVSDRPAKHFKDSKSQEQRWIEPPVLASNTLVSNPTSKPLQETSSIEASALSTHESPRKRRSKHHPKEFIEPPIITDDELSYKLIPAQVKRMTAKVGYPGREDEWGKPSRVAAAIASANGAPPPTAKRATKAAKKKGKGKRKGARKVAAPEPAADTDDPARDENNDTAERGVVQGATAGEVKEIQEENSASNSSATLPESADEQENVFQDGGNITTSDSSSPSNTKADLSVTEDSPKQAASNDTEVEAEQEPEPEQEQNPSAQATETTTDGATAALTPLAMERFLQPPPPLSVHGQPQRVSHVRWSAFEPRTHATNPALLRVDSTGLVAGVRKRSAEFLALAGEEEERRREKRVCSGFGAGNGDGRHVEGEEQSGRDGEDGRDGRDGYYDDDDNGGDVVFDADTEEKMAALVRDTEVRRRLTGALAAWREEQAMVREREKAATKARAERLEAGIRLALGELLPGFGLDGDDKTKAMEEFDEWFAGLSGDARQMAMKIVMEGGDWAHET